MRAFFSFFIALLILSTAFAQKDDSKKELLSSGTFSGLKFRSIGPAFTSGRIADFAVNPKNHSEYYVAVASGNLWKTTNSGTTWKPIADTVKSYSYGVVVIDPNNYNVVWAGTGENNHQRALGYGCGVIKSTDGGESWYNMGLENSRQIGGIVIDPRNSNTVFVAAEGSVWGPGGERGLYKTIDGGKTWKKVLEISENTGVNNVVIDPKNPDILYATSEQRRRTHFTKIGGGPESAVYRSLDNGENWEKIVKGLPSVQIGGMGIAVSPINSDVVYLIVEAAEEKGGFYRSINRGSSWERMSDHNASGQYYNEIYCDPIDIDKVYSVETLTHYTEDAGKTWTRLSNSSRHVDDHALWIDPADNKHFLIGGDGGIYESFDGGDAFLFKCNLPVTQFYRVNVDNDFPFYNVYGGTQDNNSFGGPSQTLSRDGIVNDDWYVTNGGDGFWTASDPTNPDIVYAEAQYGNMVRYDRKSGEALDIRPEPRKGEDSYKWNWNTPLFISPHSHTRIYCAANKAFRSDDRGNSWQVISDDLTAQIDRNTWQVMGKYWSIDAVGKDVSSSLFGTIVSMTESPVKENLLYVGTDDGVIQVSEDAKTWRKIDAFPGVPANTYVSDILSSRFDENVVYASFDNIKRDDFKPYLLKSNDKGKTWESISNNLPENGTVHSVEQDFENPDLLFIGTEFGFYFSVNGGGKWLQLKNGLPVVAVKDIALQKRENDIALATFGRGFYILDNYSPLRFATEELLKKEAYIFPIKDALMYIEKGGRYGQGHTYFKAPNPDFGAVFTYYIKDVPKTLKQLRHKKEKDLFKESKPIPQPKYSELRDEEKEVSPYLIFTIKDDRGNIVKKITASASSGVSRIVWDLRYDFSNPLKLTKNKFDPTAKPSSGMLAMPGKYNVTLQMVVRDSIADLTGAVEFNTVTLANTTLPAEDRAVLVAFQQKAVNLFRTVRGTQSYLESLAERIEFIRQAVNSTPGISEDFIKRAGDAGNEAEDILFAFNGEKPKASAEEVPPHHVSINDRLSTLVYSNWGSTSIVTEKMESAYNILLDEFPPVWERVKKLAEQDVKALEGELEKAGAPYTPGRLPALNLR
ncbi:MAG: glycosyl hydrolase [Ignavibacteriaceae bacterium]|nr:glycosyl hydrolase [Ignavibacteriaceae bacterium]